MLFKGNPIESKNYSSQISEAGKKIAQISDRKEVINYEFITSPQIRTSASIFFSRVEIGEELLESMENFQISDSNYDDLTFQDKIAAVISHELVHSNGRHAIKSIEKILSYCFLVSRINFVVSGFFGIVVGSLFSLYMYATSRSNEFQADRFGMFYMEKAGYNPKAALWLHEFFIYEKKISNKAPESNSKNYKKNFGYPSLS